MLSHQLLAGTNSALSISGNTKGLIPASVLCGDDGYIYVVDTSVGGMNVIKTLPSGVISSQFGIINSTVYGGYPHGMAYFNESGVSYIYDLNPDLKTITKHIVSPFVNGPVGLVTYSGSLSFPTGLAVISNGDLLVSDKNDRLIRRINMTRGYDGTYSMKIVAGMVGFSGYGGERVNATNASLDAPTGITFYGNAFYFAETGAHIIRKVDLQTGVLITVAGSPTFSGDSGDDGPALAAKLNSPLSVGFNSIGEMFISDSGNHKIKKVFLNGTITTIAGNGVANFSGDGYNAKLAQLNMPTFISVSNTGDIYVIDSNNYRIRKISGSSNVISTNIGNGLARNYGENVVASQASFLSQPGFTFSLKYPNNLIYVADSGNNRIRSFSSFYSGLNIKTVAGMATAGLGNENVNALSSNFNNPTNLVFHPISGELLIVDTNNHRIRSMSVSGIVKTIAGNGTMGYNGEGLLSNMTLLNSPTGIAVFSTGEVVFADTGNNLLRIIDLNGKINTFVNVTKPMGIAITSNDEVLIGDSVNHRILRCTKKGTCWTFAGTFGVSGNNPSAFKIVVPVSQLLLNQPTYIAPNKAGDVYVVDSGNSRIVKIARDGKAVQLFKGLVNPGNILFNEYEQSPLFVSSDMINELKISCSSSNYVVSIYDYACNLIMCSGVSLTNSSVCSSHGVCTAMDTCVCNTDDSYFGKNCEFKLCNGAQISSSQACVIPQTPSVSETKVETVLISSLDSKNVTFSKFTTIQVSFPSSFVSQLNSSGSVSSLNIDLVSSVVNQTLDTSLNSLSDNNTVLVVSSIISISLYDRDTGKEISVQKLADPINIQMKSISIPNSLLANREFSFVCMYLESSTNSWKTDGVETIIQIQQNTTETLTFSTVCKTSHLTSFAVIDPTYKKAANPSTNSGVLDLGTIIGIAVGGGAGLLIVCTMMVLLIVVLVVCCVKKRK